MTVNTTDSSVLLPGNGVATVFPYAFKVNQVSDLLVYLIDNTTQASTLLVAGQYTVSQNVNLVGGSVTVAGSPVPSTQSVSIIRQVDLKQATDITNQGAFFPEIHESVWDKIVMMVQQSGRLIGRQLSKPFAGGDNYDAGGSKVTGVGNATVGSDVPNLAQVQALVTSVSTGIIPSLIATYTSLAASAGSSLVGFLQSGSGSIVRTVADKLQDTKSVFDWMTAAQIADVRAGTFAIDCTAAIQAAINATTGTLNFPAGLYRINGSLSWTKSGLFLVGSGQSRTRLMTYSTNTDTITVGDGTANPNFGGVYGMSIESQVTKTAGAAIRFRNGHSLEIEQILINNPYIGIQLDGGAGSFFYWVRRFEISNPAVGIGFGLDGTLPGDVWIDNGYIYGPSQQGLFLKNLSGGFIHNVDIAAGAGSGVVTFADAGHEVEAVFFSNVFCDTLAGTGWALSTNGGTLADITLTDCWASNCGTTTSDNGILITQGAGTTRGIKLNAPMVSASRGSGIYIQSGTDVHIVNPAVCASSYFSAGTKHGIEIAANVSEFSIIGGACGNVGFYNNTTQGYGIYINAGTSANFVIQGVNLTGNVSGTLNQGATGTGWTISACPGYVTATNGTTAIIGGTTSITVNHGCNGTPAVQVTPTGDPQQRWWVTGLSATQFTVNMAAAASGNVFFYWSARTGNS